MTVLDYVSQNDIQKFYCKTITKIVLVHTHRSRSGIETEISELFGRENLGKLKDWNKYKSFYSFADKEIVKIEKDFMGTPLFCPGKCLSRAFVFVLPGRFSNFLPL